MLMQLKGTICVLYFYFPISGLLNFFHFFWIRVLGPQNPLWYIEIFK